MNPESKPMRTILIFLALLLPCATLSQNEAYRGPIPLPSKAQVRWHGYERIMFVHFSANTWQTHRGLDNEYDDLSTPLARINPAQLNTDQWCRVAKSWGARMILFVAKHGGGFAMWRTNTTEYGIKNTAWRNGRGDILADLSKSCRKFGLDLGIYLYPGDPHWGAGSGSGGITSDSTRQKEYTKIFRRQLTEVLTTYGEIREVWFDGSCRINVDDILKKHASHAVIFQGPMASLRWVGNEDGFAPFSNWYTLPAKDLRTGVATAVQSDPFGDAYAPVEIDVPLLKNGGHKWFWAPNTEHLIMTTDQLMNLYYKSVGRGAVLLLNSTPDTTGLIPPAHVLAYKAFGDEIRRRFGTPLAKRSGTGKMLELSFAAPTEVNHVVIQEDVAKGQRVLAFTVEGLDARGEARELYAGTSVGSKRICPFPAATVKKLRLSVTNAKATPQIANFAAFNVSGVNVEPEVREGMDRFYDGVGNKQGAVAAAPRETEVGSWASGEPGQGWQEIRLDLTKEVTKVGQYELAFTAGSGSERVELAFKEVGAEMYGAAIPGAIEQVEGRPVFRLTKSQQTLDAFPVIVKMKMKSLAGGGRGSITIKRIAF
jgi:alpha-L-fucosidase